jgi:hypothetical protein
MYYTHNDSDTICDIPPLNKDGQSQSESLRGVITEVMMHNTSCTRIKHMKCSEIKLYYSLNFRIRLQSLSGREIKYILWK